MAIDDARWLRLIFHLLDECAADEPDPMLAERAAVVLYTAIHHRLNDPEEP